MPAIYLVPTFFKVQAYLNTWSFGLAFYREGPAVKSRYRLPAGLEVFRVGMKGGRGWREEEGSEGEGKSWHLFI